MNRSPNIFRLNSCVRQFYWKFTTELRHLRFLALRDQHVRRPHRELLTGESPLQRGHCPTQRQGHKLRLHSMFKMDSGPYLGHLNLVGGFNPYQKYACQIGSFRQLGVKKKHVKPPNRNDIYIYIISYIYSSQIWTVYYGFYSGWNTTRLYSVSNRSKQKYFGMFDI